jgi:ribosomal protein S27E
MVTCRGCGGEYEAGDLCRHETEGLVRVHCPDCGRTLGTYNERR